MTGDGQGWFGSAVNWDRPIAMPKRRPEPAAGDRRSGGLPVLIRAALFGIPIGAVVGVTAGHFPGQARSPLDLAGGLRLIVGAPFFTFMVVALLAVFLRPVMPPLAYGPEWFSNQRLRTEYAHQVRLYYGIIPGFAAAGALLTGLLLWLAQEAVGIAGRELVGGWPSALLG